MGLAPLTIDSSTGLTNIPYGVAYALCKSMMCRQCGHLFADYRFSDAEMARLYTDYRGELYEKTRDSYEPGYAEMNKTLLGGVPHMPKVEKFLEGFLPPTELAILDWGGDTGVNTPFAGRRSLLHIYDPSGRDGTAGATTSSTIPSTGTEYDLIVLSHVLEHIPYPMSTLKEVLPFMGQQTVLYVEVPLERLQHDLAGPPYSGAHRKKHWHEHINFFTMESMRTLLSNAGLDVVCAQVADITEWQ